MALQDGDARADLLVFVAAGQLYALPVAEVREVVPRAQLTPLPGAPAGVLGVLRLRGQLVPVVDLQQRFGLLPSEPQVSQRIVVAVLDSRAVGLIVDAVEGLAQETVVESVAGRLGSVGFVRSIAETPERLVTVLDLAAVLGPEIAACLSSCQPADAGAPVRAT